MIQSLVRRLQKLRSNLNLAPIIRLIWSVSRKWTLISLLSILVETIFYFGFLYILKLLINVVAHEGLGTKSHDQIVFYLLGAGIIGILYFLIRAVSTYTTEIQAAYVSEFVNDKIHEKTISLDLSFFEDDGYFDVLKRTMEAGTQRPTQVIMSLFDILKNCMTILALGSVLLTIDWVLLPLLIVLVIPTLLIRLNFSDVFDQWRIRKTPWERRSDYLSSLITTDQAAKEIRAFNLGPHMKEAYLKIRMKLLDERLLISRKRTKNEMVTTTMAAIGFFICIGYIILNQGKGVNSVGNITLFLVVFPQTFLVLQNLASGISSLYQNSIFINSIFELLGLRSQLPESDNPVPVPETEPLVLEIRNVSFSYPHVRSRSLQEVNLRLEQGKITAVVGANGAGKSSLIKLICRLYDPGEGSIRLNGIDIRQLDSLHYREQIGVVFQDFMRYQMSVRDNIAYGNIRREFSEARMKAAARLAGADEFIQELPEGYESILGKLFEDGRELSIGQWQKMAIARCLYSRARLLILDEASSSLDALAEQAVFKALRSGMGDRAALIVSHRYAVTRHADYIYVLSRGRVVEAGTSEELVAAAGEYASLFRDQMNAETELI